MAVVPYSSSSDSNSYKYDVFISFRGEDTRKNITSHLYAALRRSSIETYIDEKSLERGEEISPALLTAIEESQLSLVVFSQNYASSRWCLDELVHILKYKKENGQIVIPLFYHVDPSDVRNQRGSYDDAFVAHQKRPDHDKKKEDAWRNALKEAAGLSGFDLKNESEAEFVKNIVKDVREKLKNILSTATANYFKGLVGMTKRFNEMKPLLSMDSTDVPIVGICGMAGIGKTTLAKALRKRFSSEFDISFFMDLKEEVSKHGLNNAAEKLSREVLKHGQLRRKKVLLVLDNVDELQQLQHLLQMQDVRADFCRWFGVGSRIIIISSDKKVLTDITNRIYEVKPLNSFEAHELFCSKAFKRNYPEPSYFGLAQRLQDYAEGHPLTLEVLGSSLYGRSRAQWESTLSKLKKCPDKKIQDVLKPSFDVLDRMERSMFLDIACFFNGMYRDYLELIHGDGANITISVLIERSLITIDSFKKIQMHGLIQEMGREIAHQEGSRLLIAEDVLHVLENNKGTDKIEAISLDLSEVKRDPCLGPTVFEKMYKLRVLKIYHSGEMYFKVKLQDGLHYLPNSLRYLHWCDYPLKTLPSNFSLESLVELEMPNSQLYPQPWHGVKALGNLKCIDLRDSEQLVKIPDLSRATRLESIGLQSCISLTELPPIKLHNFDSGVQPFGNLSHVSRPESTDPQDSKRLGDLNLFGCTNLEILPELSGNIGFLTLSMTRIKELPSSISSCESLLELDLSYCEELEILSELPRNIVQLDLSKTSIQGMPAASIECLQYVERIDLRDCGRLESLPSNFCKLKALIELELSGCSNLKSFPEISEPMENLSHVDLSNTGIQELPTSFELLIGLERLEMEGCINLKTIPAGLAKLNSLSSLTFRGCSKLESFPNMLLGLRSLEKLNLSYCNIFEIPSWIGELRSLTEIKMKGNMFATIPSGIKRLSKLKSLDLRDCQNLQSLPELPLSVDTLDADGCMSLGMVLKTSRSTFAQGWWDNDSPLFSSGPKFMLRGCLELEESACNNIAIDYFNRLAYTRMRSKGMVGSETRLCYAGSKIPEWMRHQSEGFSELTIKLPPNWQSSKLPGFVACVVLSLKELCLHVNDGFDICCTVHFKTKNGQSRSINDTFRWPSGISFLLQADKEKQIEEIFHKSDHVFMWYVSFYDDCSDAVEMSVSFFCAHRFYGCIDRYSSKHEVKRCGVHMLYHIEEELGSTTGLSRDSSTIHEMPVRIKQLPRSQIDSHSDQTNNIGEGDSDAIINEAEPSIATQVIHFDSDDFDRPPLCYTDARKRRKQE